MKKVESLKETILNAESPDSRTESQRVDGEQVRENLKNAADELLTASEISKENIYSNVLVKSPEFVQERLGWERVNIHRFVAESITSPPYVAVCTLFGSEQEIEGSDPNANPGEDDPFLDSYTYEEVKGLESSAEAEITIVLTNAYIVVSDQSNFDVIPYGSLTKSQLESVINRVNPPQQLPTGNYTGFPASHHPNQTRLTRWLFGDATLSHSYNSSIQTDYFELDIDKYANLLYSAYSAEESQEKGKALEEAISFLFRGLQMMSVRERNLRTKSVEIDIVLEYDGFSEYTLFEEFSRFVLIECKNTNGAVPAKQLGFFREKLRNTGVQLGILIAWNGITGSESNRNAHRLNDFGHEDPLLLVMTSRDLYRILDGVSLYEIVDEKLFSNRFDL